MKLYLIRHGQSEGNVRQVFHGQFDYPLTAQGRQEALLCGEKLRDVPLTHCYASDLQRARDTAALALQASLKECVIAHWSSDSAPKI